MKPLISLADETQAFFESRGWKFCFIGGLALQQWGEPRLTQDIDISLLTGFGGEEEFIDLLMTKFPARIPDAKNFALQRRVLLLRSENGIGLDIALAGLPFEEEVIQRAVIIEFLPGVSLRICSAEDLVVFKAFADRRKDWADIESIVLRQAASLDWEYIDSHISPLAEIKEAPHILVRLDGIRKMPA